MGFESGSLSFRMFHVPGGLPDDSVARFSADAAPPIDSLGTEAISGWVSGRHLLDRHITEENALVAGRLRLTLMKAERKIPAALLQAECALEQIAVMQAEDKPFVDRRTKSEIKKLVTERLLPTMPPTLTGIPIAYEHAAQRLYGAATTDKQVDALVARVRQTTGKTPVPLTPETLAMQRRHVDTRDLPATSFSPECDDGEIAGTPGLDFLTWLWFLSEEHGGEITTDDHTYAVMVEGPLVFFREGHGAHVTSLQQGDPMVATEARAALLTGKKLRRARLVMACGEETWQCTLDAASFLFRSMKLPKTEAWDPVGRFEERMLSLARFADGFAAAYDRFIATWSDPGRWQDTREAMQRWVTARPARG